MNKIFYLTDSTVQLIDAEKLANGNDYLDSEILWEQKDQVETLLLTLDGKSSFSVIFDFVDESISHDWVPKLMPWEKSNYEKKIKSKFHDNAGLFIRVNWLGEYRKNENGATEELMMTSSVYGSEDLKNFFLIIEEAQLSIQTIHSYPFLLEKYFLASLSPTLGVTKSKLKNPFLLVLQEGKHTYRQIFFLHGILRISRVIELEEELETDEALMDGVVNESFATIKYLYNQKIVPFNSSVGIVYLSTSGKINPDMIKEFSDSAPFSIDENKKNLTISADLYEVKNKKHVTESPYGLLSFLSVFIQKKSTVSFYENAFLSKLLLFKNSSVILTVVIFMTLIFGSLYLVSLGVSDFLLKEKISAMDVKIKQYQGEKNSLQKVISLTYDAQDIKASVDFSQSILDVKKTKLFESSLDGLSIVLSQHPHILMDKLKWQKNQYFDSNKLEIYLEGWVYPFNVSYEKPVKWVDNFVDGLKKHPNFSSVEAVSEPLNRSLKKAISISVDDIKQVNALPFSIRLTMGGKGDKSQ